MNQEIKQFFDELVQTHQIKSYFHDDDCSIPETLIITFNNGKSIVIDNWGIEYKCPMFFTIKN